MFLDFETMSECDIKDSGADAYARHHTTTILCMAFSMKGEKPTIYIPREQLKRAMRIDPIPFTVTTDLPQAVLDHIENGGDFVAHNASFDAQIWNNCTEWPKVKPRQIRDTMAQACAMALPASLGALGEALSVEVKKSPSGTRLISKMCKPPFQTGPSLLAEMAEYCARDVESMIEIDKHLMPLNPKERKTWEVNYRANQNGVELDQALISECIRLSGDEDNNLAQHVQSIAGLTPAQLRSPKQLLEWCHSQGVDLPSLNKADLAVADFDNPHVQQVLDIRAQVCRTSIKKFFKMLSVICPDGRARGNHVYHRATTGRFAGAGVQVQNLPRPAFDNTDDVADHIVEHGTLPDGLGVDTKTALTSVLRSCIVAPKGSEFYCADFSSIESRVLFWLADDFRGLKVYKTGHDLYCVTAGAIFGYPVSKKDHPQERSIGKVAVLSCGYGGGVKAFTGMCEQLGVDLQGRDPKTIVDGYRETYARTKSFWYECEAGAIQALQNIGEVVRVGKCKFKYSTKHRALGCMLPSGRWIQWPFAEIDENGQTPWGTAKAQIKYKGMGLNHKWQWLRTYGGDIAQSLTQAVARDLLTEAMVRMYDAGFKVVLHVHDEIMVEMPEGVDQYKEFLRLMKTTPQWAEGLPVEATGFKARRYQK
jgi:DNA polymerase bacteriophage-type